VALANDLLEVARQLCPSTPGRPSHALLRRCISTAYYAVFHALSDEIARPYREAVRSQARRLLDHSHARDVAQRLQGATATLREMKGQPSCHADLRQFAASFDQLYAARQRADYDVEYTPTKKDAMTAVRRAERTIDALAKARSACPDQLQVMCVTMLASPQTRKRMRA
jgi:uncharacterized protein (UPF0332 family)